ncbi:hypothetical protein Tco_0411358 [Tanacetum coccineum]
MTMYSPQKFHEPCTKLSTETTPPGRSISQNYRAITPSHLTTNPVTTTAHITSRRCHSPVIDPPLPSLLVLDLEKAMTAQEKEIAILRRRVRRGCIQTWEDFKARLIYKEDEFNDGFDVVRDEGITHVEGDAEQVVIAAAEVVNAGVSVSTAEPKTHPTTTTTTLLENDKVIVAATCANDVRHLVNSIVFERCGRTLLWNKEKAKAPMVVEDVHPL